MVPWTEAVRTDDVVVLHADGNRLRVAEAQWRRVTTRARVIVVQTEEAIVKGQPAKIGQLVIDLSAQPPLQRLAHPAGEPVLAEKGGQLIVESAVVCLC